MNVEEKTILKDLTNKPEQVNVRIYIVDVKITLISYDYANVWRNVKGIQLTAF